jgi:hypothetical protein
MTNYQLGKIYRITCNLTNQNYYGSTCEPTLSKRLAKHVSNFKDWLKLKNHATYITSYEILKNGDYVIVLVENYPCNNKDELLARERYYIENNECVNKVIPKRTKAETDKAYAIANKDKIQEYKKQYYEINKEKIIEKGKIYYEDNKEKLLDYHKKYYEEHKEEIASKVDKEHKKEYMEAYRENNKNIIAKKTKEYRDKNKKHCSAVFKAYYEKHNKKHNCACGGRYTELNYKKHVITQQHCKYQKMVDDLAKINKDHQDMMNRHKQMYGSNK